MLGEQRTAEELGRAFPQVPVRTSAGDRVLATVDDRPSVVVATPGAEPVAEGGYACVVLLDTWLMLGRTDLRTGEEALRRWFAAAALARPADHGGRVVAVGEPSDPALQALVRWDPAGYAGRELEDRQSAHLPPASRLATLTGPEADLDSGAGGAGAAAGRRGARPGAGRGDRPGADAEAPPSLRAVVRVPRAAGPRCRAPSWRCRACASARKLPPVRVQVDPVGLE